MGKQNIYDLDLEEWQQYFVTAGEPAYRANQVWEGLYVHLASASDQFSTLSKSLREKIQQDFSFENLRTARKLESRDSMTQKFSFFLQDNKVIETVLMRYDKRNTICVSSQSGCAMGCVFCATGQMGFGRNLTAGEIVEQVIYFARQLRSVNEKITNIVLMGMGEPFHNFLNVIKAIDILNHHQGYNLGERRFTISTVGLTPGIQKFTSLKRQINLAISLHAANDELRSTMLPVAKKYPMTELMNACREYIAETGRRVTFEYALINEINDTEHHAHELANLLKGMLCHVNVIPLNPTKKYEGKATTQARARSFQAILQQAGIPCTIRLRRGIEIQAGCGQLASETTVI
ncbi:MAG: 23S rRNA (adenine(2503)-C(2))-methyltransferase RlmN [Anaerolineaceae bacterium]